jgi:hypothetical protein
MSLTNYSREYIQALLSHIAYVNMNGEIINDIEWDDFVGKSLIDNKINFLKNYEKYLANKFDGVKVKKEYNSMLSSIELFVNNFKILRQVNVNLNGFSAITYELINDLPMYGYTAGEIFIAFRGTEGEGWDYWTDFKLVFITNFDYGDYGTQQNHAMNYVIGEINANNNFYLTGHSLGGHLAAVTLLKLRDEIGISNVRRRIKTVSTFNPAGISVFTDKFDGSGVDDLITNYFSVRGVNLVTANVNEPDRNFMITTFDHLGKRQPVITENAGGGDNHDITLLVKAFGVYSTLETLISSFPTSIVDLDEKTLTGNSAKTYSFERLLMNATYQEGDEGIAIDILALNIIDGFGLTKDLLPYSNSISNFIHLKSYFNNNQDFKIKIVNLFMNVTNINNNLNRSSVYSLINDLAYSLIAPEKYDKGIFKKDSLIANKDIYNPENYSYLYFDYKIRFNRLFLEMLERKIILDIKKTYSVVDSTIINKFAYINNLTKMNGSQEKILIYVNTTPEESSQNIRYVEFKNLKTITTNIYFNNTLLFDSSEQDYINSFSSYNTLQIMNSDDYLVFDAVGIENTVVIQPMSDYINILNKNELFNSLSIDFTELENDTIKFKIVKIFDEAYKNVIEIKYGSHLINLSGIANFVFNQEKLFFKDISSIFFNFKEVFNENRYYDIPVIDNAFIDNFIKVTSIKYGEINLDNLIEKDYTKVTNEHVNFIISRLKSHEIATGFDVSILIDYVKSKETKLELISSLPTLLNPVFNEIKLLVNDSFVVEQLTKALVPFSSVHYTNFEDIKIDEHLNIDFTKIDDNPFSSVFYPLYRKKETKIYESKYNSETSKLEWVWTGNYDYDYELDGNKLDGRYGWQFPNGSKPINYYRKNIILNSDFTTIYGTEGSDIIIADNAYGNSPYFGNSGNVISGEIIDRPNGNDILIGKLVKAYSGDNLLVSDSIFNKYTYTYLYGGSGNDVFISNIGATIKTNDWTDSIDTDINHNIVFLLDQNNFTTKTSVYSSNARNIIIHKTEKNENHGNIIVYSTGNDTYIGDGFFIANEMAYKAALNINEFNLNIDKNNEYFYSKYSKTQSINHIYSTNSGLSGVLGIGDYADLSIGSGVFHTMGANTILIGSNYKITSGGNSILNINGENNVINLGYKDFIVDDSSFKNKIFLLESYTEIDDVLVETHILRGTENDLHLGESINNIKLNGYNNNIYFDKNNINNNYINIDEGGISRIFVNTSKSINNIVVDSKNKLMIGSKLNNIFPEKDSHGSISNLTMTSISTLDIFDIDINSCNITIEDNLIIRDSNINKIELITKNNIEILNSNIDEFNFVGAEDLNVSKSKIKNINSNSKIQKVTIEKTICEKMELKINDVSSITNCEIAYLKLESDSNLTVLDSTVKDFDIYGKQSIKVNIKNNPIENFKFISLDESVLEYTGDVKKLIVSNAVITGEITNNESFIFTGTIDNLMLSGDKDLSVVNIEGFIKNGSFSNIKDFSYNPTLYLNDLATINVSNSGIANFENMKNMRNIDMFIDSSNFGKFELISMKSSKLRLRGTFTSFTYPKTIQNSYLSIYGDNKDIIDFNIGKIIIKSSNSSFIMLHDKNIKNMEITAKSFIEIYGDNDKEIRIDLRGSNVLIHDIVDASLIFAYGDIVEIDVDTVNGLVNFSRQSALIKLKTLQSIVITKNKIGNYIFENNDMANYQVDVSGTIYTKQQIENLRTIFRDVDEAYAIISDHGVELFNIPEIDEPFIDSNGIYQGTYKNDIYTLSGSGPYTLHGKKGDDIYNFTSYNNYSRNTINYSIGDGHDTVNSLSMLQLLINLDGIYSNELKFTAIKDAINRDNTLNIYYLDNHIFTINNYANTSLEIKTVDKTMNKLDISKPLSSIYGTSGDDVITTLYNEANYIYPGAGNDIINIVGGYNLNEIYYNLGDGHDTVNTQYYNYTVIFSSDIDKSLITYDVQSVTGFNVKYNNEVIVTINQPAYCKLKFLSNNEIINGINIYNDLITIYGTDFDDIINVDNPVIVKSKGGNDIINVNVVGATIYAGSGNNQVNINYIDTTFNSTVVYDGVNGITNIKLLDDIGEIFNKVTINLYNLNSLKFEYDKNNHNTLNIYNYIGMTGIPVKIMTIENYRRVIWETYTNGRASINQYYGANGVTSYYHSNIDTEAERNYQLLIKK